jgi:hypothetical protein
MRKRRGRVHVRLLHGLRRFRLRGVYARCRRCRRRHRCCCHCCCCCACSSSGSGVRVLSDCLPTALYACLCVSFLGLPSLRRQRRGLPAAACRVCRFGLLLGHGRVPRGRRFRSHATCGVPGSGDCRILHRPERLLPHGLLSVVGCDPSVVLSRHGRLRNTRPIRCVELAGAGAERR